MNFNEMVTQLQQEQDQIMLMKQQLDAAMASYKEKVKNLFGIADGEQFNILELLKAIKTVQNYAD